MDIKLQQIPIREIVNGYVDNAEAGVRGYGGKLDIRPPYQREFIYNTEQSREVIRSIIKNFPLNVMYWIKGDDGNYQVLDGQQRTISICRYHQGGLTLDDAFFENSTDEEQDQFLDYKLMVYFCKGSEREILDWFRIINIAGEKLTPQELLNAVYTGPWLSDAKAFFSKTGCAAYGIANEYINGVPLRQEYLETAIKWINDGKVEGYMAKNQKEKNADELKQYFRDVFAWVEKTFPPVAEYRREMKGVDWGNLYNAHKDDEIDTDQLAEEVAKLMEDDDVSNKHGIFSYVVTGKEKHLSLRTFTDSQKREAYQRQKGKCKKCKKEHPLDKMHADHIKPWSKGGKTVPANCQILCVDCNRKKSDV